MVISHERGKNQEVEYIPYRSTKAKVSDKH
jgi:hypothetical protein